MVGMTRLFSMLAMLFRALSFVAVVLTVLVLIPYLGLGPAGEYAPGGPDWGGFIVQGLLIAGVGFGTAVLMHWAARRAEQHAARGQPTERPVVK
jgi:type VI protein secretion system component VasK